MIRFTLCCGNDHEFEGWFRDGAAFEQQVAAGQLACPVCADGAVRKAIMAPAVTRGRSGDPAEQAQRMAAMVQVLRKVREHVETNFDHVGERFAEEARRIHYGEADKRDIWGQATAAEASDLHEEGIAVRPLPELPELDG